MPIFTNLNWRIRSTPCPDTFPYTSDDDAPPCFPSKYPYQELDNVVMMPHRGADHRMEHLQLQLRAMLSKGINQLSQRISPPSRISPNQGS